MDKAFTSENKTTSFRCDITFSMPHVFIIIVNWNGKKDTIACLSSLKRLNTKGIQVDIIVVDNGSSDDSIEVIRKKFPEVFVHESGENLGFTGGNNVGISLALQHGANYVWLLNNDTLADKEALQSLLSAFTDDRVGISGSKIYFAAGREYHKDKYKASERGKVLWYAGGLIDWNNMYASHRGVDEVDNGQYDQIEEAPFVTGCSMMIKTKVFDSIDKFNDTYYLYLEDLDFCLRAQKAGFHTLYIPSSIIWHVNAGSSGGPGSKLHEYYLTRNRLLIALRFAPIRTKLALLRESVRFFLHGTSIQKKAVTDFMLGKWGNQPYDA